MTGVAQASRFGLKAAVHSGAGGALLLALAAVAAAAMYWSGFVHLVDAWSVPEYSHGPIIPLISAFLFLREMRAVPPAPGPVTDRWPGVAVTVLGLAVGFAGHLARIDHIVTYGFIVWTAGLVLTLFGLRRGVLFWPAILHLVFMLPLPQIVYWQVSTYLQAVSSEIGVAVIALMGVPVYLDGNIIDLGVYKLQVAEACSGLRYLFPMLSFSYVFAILYQGPAWHKAILLLSAAPITVAMNSFRIGVIGVMVDNFGIEYAEGFLHTFEGWIIFLSCVAILMAMAWTLQRLAPRPKPLSEALDIEFSGLGTQLRRVWTITPSAALVTLIVATAAVAAAKPLIGQDDAPVMERAPLVTFPRELGPWSSRINPPLDPLIEQVLAADDYYSATFVSEGPAPVDLFMAYYHNQMDGTGIHSPEVCIPGGGWEVSDWRTISVPVPDGSAIEANRAVIQKGMARQLVYYWFDLRGRRIAGDFQAKWINLVDLVTLGRSDGALVRIITPILPNEPEEAADERLRRFMTELAPHSPRFIPR